MSPPSQVSLVDIPPLGGTHSATPPSHHANAAMPADAGMVTIHAITMLPATPQRTADEPRTVPTPTIAPVMVCVVDTGMPKYVAMNNVIEPAHSAAKPPIGRSFVMRCPIVFTIRQPPNIVPMPIARKQLNTTHVGRWSSVVSPFAISNSQITPMVFCASLPP